MPPRGSGARDPWSSPSRKRTRSTAALFRALLAHPETTDRYDDLIFKYARLHRLEPRLLKAIIAAESEFSTGALSPRGARGLMQVMPRTAEEMGISRAELSEPEANIRGRRGHIWPPSIRPLGRLTSSGASPMKTRPCGLRSASSPPTTPDRAFSITNRWFGRRGATSARSCSSTSPA